MRELTNGRSGDDSSKIDFEIYYQPGHEYNLDRMMRSMKQSLGYYSKHFSPYPYRQVRIMEYPRYRQFAQSFPGTVPYSEAIGFVMDIDDDRDADMPFYITAHELAHQWWGLQLVAANVQGQNMILESLAQYSAMMVLKQAYGEEQVHRYLAMERERYQQGQQSDSEGEKPLAWVEGQEYNYYSKGAINLYALQDYITEDSMNLALRRFIEDWNSVDGVLQKDRYPTTADLLDYVRAVTPDSLQYVITDLLETNTSYALAATTSAITPLADGQYLLHLTIEATKYRLDSLGSAAAIPTDDWVDIGVYSPGTDGEPALIYLKKHKLTSRQSQLAIRLDQRPTQAGVDPFGKLMDRKLEDNVVELGGGTAL